MSVPYLVAQNTPKPVPITPSSAAISGLSNKGREVISAAQIAHPDYYHNNLRDAFNSLKSKISDTFEDATQPSSPPSVPIPNSGKSVSMVNIPEIEFINADLAKHYGMSKSTAYQEALSNTSYQRAVKDMKAAGLNPSVMFGSGRSQGASSSIYASEASSGGGYSGRRGSGSSGSSGNGNLFSSGMYYGISTAVGLATAVMTKNPANYWIGSAGAQGVMGALNAALKK